MRHKRQVGFIVGLYLTLFSALAWSAPLKNQLRQHASPYLALHGNDPVAWQEWNAETLARAKRENKLLFVSVGYFSCHWCHVMQKESYSNPEIAAVLNQYFIPVKVDRELNGALDAALIEFSEALSGAAGWPLNAFVTPEGYPAYSVLYEPPAKFKALLTHMAEAWRKQGAAFRKAALDAARATQAVPQREDVSPAGIRDAHQRFMQAMWQNADTLQGGFNRVSKFPMHAQLAYLLETYAREREPRLGEFLRLTLDQMQRLGLRDHVNGGFFRYTVDPDWNTPHFEKMLYDNAQLARLYARAATLFKRDDYQRIAYEILDFMLADLHDPGGGFHTALSALDNQGREGGGYLWTAEELRQRLSSAEYALASRIWGLDQPAPFELGYLPMQKTVPTADERTTLNGILNKLKASGRKQQVPADTKINAGLNGLALSALSEAGRGEPRFERAAGQLRNYLARRLVQQGQLLKTRAGTRVFAEAELEDYAFAAAGLADYARLFGDPGARRLAGDLVRQAWQRFFSDSGWRREAHPLLATLLPEPALADGALPSASARLMAVTQAMLNPASKSDLNPLLRRASALLLPAMSKAPFEHASALAVLRER